MAEQGANNALSLLSETFEKLNEARRNLGHCKEERAAAGDVLAASEDFLRRIKSTLNNLQRERELRRRRDENRAKLERLKTQVEGKAKEETAAQKNLGNIWSALTEFQAEESRLRGERDKNAIALKALKGRIREKKKDERRAKKNVKQIRTALARFQAEESRLRGEQARTVSELETLKSQIENKQEEETRAGQNLKTAQSNLTALEKQAPTSLKQDENGTKPKDAESQSQDGGQAGDEASGEKQKEKRRAECQVHEAREVLKKKKRTVVRAAISVNIQAEKIPLKAVKESIFRLGKWLEFTGVTGCGYAYAVLLGVTYEIAFYRQNGINILDYSMPADFFLAGLKLLIIPLLAVFLSLILLLIYWRFISKLARLPIPRYTECMAGVFPRFAEGIPVKTLLIFFLVLPLTISYGVGHLRLLYNAAQVAVVTTQPLQMSDGPFVKIGANSAYLFIRSAGQSDDNPKTSDRRTETKDAHSLLAIPLSQIVCVSENDNDNKGCESAATGKETEQNPAQQNIVLSKEDNPWIGEVINALKENVTENGLRQYIAGKMNCSEDRLEMSEFIRFGRDEAKLSLEKKNRDQNEAKLEVEKKERERNKVPTFVNDVNKRGGKPDKWTVFGFASADGEKGKNKNLSLERAVVVKSLLCKALKCDRTNGTEIAVEGLSEDHSINGVANSRSARIAVCVEEAAS